MISSCPVTSASVSELMPSLGFSSELQSHASSPGFNTSSWMSNEHLKLHGLKVNSPSLPPNCTENSPSPNHAQLSCKFILQLQWYLWCLPLFLILIFPHTTLSFISKFCHHARRRSSFLESIRYVSLLTHFQLWDASNQIIFFFRKQYLFSPECTCCFFHLD